MLATGSFHIGAVRKLGAKFPVGLIAPITVAADKAKYEGIYNATFILGVNTAGSGQDAALKWLQFLSDPVNAGVYANGNVAARDRQERRLHERRPEAQRAVARQEDASRAALPVHQPRHPCCRRGCLCRGGGRHLPGPGGREGPGRHRPKRK